MKRILVPIDFSPTAEKAFRFALDLATRAKGTIALYHNYIPVQSTFIGSEKSRKEYDMQREADILKRMHRLKKKVAGNSSEVAVSTIVDHSPLVPNILAFAAKNQIDLIVMGTQGASGLKKTIVGSVAARLVEKSNLPVLLVPEKYEAMKPGQFVLATNFSNTDTDALARIGEIAELYEAEITVLHFLSANTGLADKEKIKIDFDNYARNLQKKQKGNKVYFHLLEANSITKTMETLDQKFPYDVMAMVRRKKTFLEKLLMKSFTLNMAYVTNKPLLIIPETELGI